MLSNTDLAINETVIEWNKHCILCDNKLELRLEPRMLKCYFCKEEYITLVCCPSDHYVCHWCNGIYEDFHNQQEFTLERFVAFITKHKRPKNNIGGGIGDKGENPLLLNYPINIDKNIEKKLSVELEKTKKYLAQKV